LLRGRVEATVGASVVRARHAGFNRDVWKCWWCLGQRFWGRWRIWRHLCLGVLLKDAMELFDGVNASFGERPQGMCTVWVVEC